MKATVGYQLTCTEYFYDQQQGDTKAICASKNSYYVHMYLNTLRWDLERQGYKVVDGDTDWLKMQMIDGGDICVFRMTAIDIID